MCTDYSPLEGIHISDSPAPDTGVRIYYDCVSAGQSVKWAYLVTVDGCEYSIHSGVSDSSVNRTELETALRALHDIPEDVNDVSVYTPCSFLYAALNGIDQDAPKQFKKLFAELFFLTEGTQAKVFCRTGNWGDENAVRCHELAERAGSESEEPANED